MGNDCVHIVWNFKSSGFSAKHDSSTSIGLGQNFVSYESNSIHSSLASATDCRITPNRIHAPAESRRWMFDFQSKRTISANLTKFLESDRSNKIDQATRKHNRFCYDFRIFYIIKVAIWTLLLNAYYYYYIRFLPEPCHSLTTTVSCFFLLINFDSIRSRSSHAFVERKNWRH